MTPFGKSLLDFAFLKTVHINVDSIYTKLMLALE